MTPTEYERFVAEAVEEGPEAGAVLVTTNDQGTDVYARAEPGRDARWVAVWMLGAYIHHVTETAREAGGDVTMEEVAEEAIWAIRREWSQ